MLRILIVGSSVIFCATGIYFYFFNNENSAVFDENWQEKVTVPVVNEGDNPIPNSDSPVSNRQEAVNDSLPLIYSTEYINLKNNAELVERARELIKTGDKSQKIRAFHILVDMSPSEALSILHSVIPNAGSDEDSTDLVAHGLVTFAQSTEYLTSSDIRNSFAIKDKNIQKISAMILEERGDAALVKQYIDSSASGLKDSNPDVRSEALKEIASVGFEKVVPYALDNLNDPDTSVKLGALEILSQYATRNDIGRIESLLNDSNKDISSYAQQIINTLWDKSTNETLSLEEKLMQPGFPVGRLAQDLN
jgi:HEAT repeat protein